MLGRHVGIQAWRNETSVEVKQHTTLEDIAAAIRLERLNG